MLFDHGQSDDLLTPTINDGGVNSIYSLLSSNDIFSSADINFYLSSLQSKKHQSSQSIGDKSKCTDDDDQQQQREEFFSSLNFSGVDEFDETEFSMVDLDMDKLFSQSLLSPNSIDSKITSASEDSMFLPVDDSTTEDDNSVLSTLPWVGSECTIDSKNTEDMMVPVSPVVSSCKRKPKVSSIDRKLRKKGQNKTAAEKYRQKKRIERDELLQRHQDLTKQNQNLKNELENFTLRLEQFKSLFADVLQIEIPTSKSNA